MLSIFSRFVAAWKRGWLDGRAHRYMCMADTPQYTFDLRAWMESRNGDHVPDLCPPEREHVYVGDGKDEGPALFTADGAIITRRQNPEDA